MHAVEHAGNALGLGEDVVQKAGRVGDDAELGGPVEQVGGGFELVVDAGCGFGVEGDDVETGIGAGAGRDGEAGGGGIDAGDANDLHIVAIVAFVGDLEEATTGGGE